MFCEQLTAALSVKVSWWGGPLLLALLPHLLLHIAEEGGVVPLALHQLGVGAVLRDLPVPHQHHLVTLRQVLPNKEIQPWATSYSHTPRAHLYNRANEIHSQFPPMTHHHIA